MTFVVTTPSFSGPVQLLLQLISVHEMDVLDVALSPIVDEFVRQLRDETIDVDVNDLSEFLLIAAILLEMKSQSLLPGRDSTEPDEEFVGWEERDVLLARLLELRTYSSLADAFVSVLRDETTTLSMDELSEFLLIGAVLLEMKSQRLLPGREAGEPDEEFVGWEERDVLLARLLELRTYAALADAFVSLFERASRAFPVDGANHIRLRADVLLRFVEARRIRWNS